MKLFILHIFLLANISNLNATRVNLVFIDQSNNPFPQRKNKPKLIWTPALQRAFNDALEQLKADAKPAMILRLMQADGNFLFLTREHVSSHLQAHKNKVKVPAEITQAAQRPSDEELPNNNNNSDDERDDDAAFTISEIENVSTDREPDFQRTPFDHILNSNAGAGFVDIMNPAPEFD